MNIQTKFIFNIEAEVGKPILIGQDEINGNGQGWLRHIRMVDQSIDHICGSVFIIYLALSSQNIHLPSAELVSN